MIRSVVCLNKENLHTVRQNLTKLCIFKKVWLLINIKDLVHVLQTRIQE